MERIDTLLSLVRENESTRWVAEQVVVTFSQGLSMSGKEAAQEITFRTSDPAGLTTRERRKREKYETTRPYTEEEKLHRLVKALKSLYIDLPAIQTAALDGLKELGIDADVLEFVAPDEPEQGHVTHTLDLNVVASDREHLASAFDEFAKAIS